jgi:phenylalanyl-tRNA synthetase beta subunit
VNLDFSFLVEGKQRYQEVADRVAGFDHPLLRRITYVDSYESGSIPAGKRSLTVRSRIGRPDRTLVDDDIASFRRAFEAFLDECGWPLRR